MNAGTLRLLLERDGSYPAIAAAVTSGDLQGVLPVTLFDHIATVYRRLETLAGPDFPETPPLRLAVLVREESPASLPHVLATAGCPDFSPTVVSVISGFGELWKLLGDSDIAGYTVAHRAHLASLLLFELAHEGQAIPQMERAAELGGLDLDFERWTERLPNARPVRTIRKGADASPPLAGAADRER